MSNETNFRQIIPLASIKALKKKKKKKSAIINPLTAGGDLSMLFLLHAGFEPTLPPWLSASWKGIKA